MKHSKRKRKSAPASTSVVENAVAPTTETVVVPAEKAPFDYALGASCTIREGAALKTALLDLEDVERTIVLDVNSVERIDTAALQLLCAFVRERRAQGRRVQWSGNPAAFIEAVEMLGLTQALGYAAEKAA